MNKQYITNKEDDGGKSPHDKEENDHIDGSKKLNEKDLGGETNNILEIVEHTNINCESPRAGSGWADNDNMAMDTNHEANRSFEVEGKVDQGGIKDSGLGILVKGVNIELNNNEKWVKEVAQGWGWIEGEGLCN